MIRNILFLAGQGFCAKLANCKHKLPSYIRIVEISSSIAIRFFFKYLNHPLI